VLVLFLAASAAPTPLYRVYQARWGFSATTLTAVFAVYVVFLLMTVLIFGPSANAGLKGARTEAGLQAWIRANAASFAHMAGTCRMGLDEGAVVDPELRVYGVDGLRVVDVSVMPSVTSAHCQGAVMAIAERASDLMLGHGSPYSQPLMLGSLDGRRYLGSTW